MTTHLKKSPVKSTGTARKREALKNHFYAVDNPARFKMIIRQKERHLAFSLSNLLTNEDKAEFFKTCYKGVKTDWKISPREGLDFAHFRVVQYGWSLDIRPKIGRFQYSLTVRNYNLKDKPNEEEILRVIQKYLPTVKVL